MTNNPYWNLKVLLKFEVCFENPEISRELNREYYSEDTIDGKFEKCFLHLRCESFE
jgi:hypothetical protein